MEDGEDSLVEPAILPPERLKLENIFTEINQSAQEKAKSAEENVLGIMEREREKSGSVASAFSSVVGEFTTADNISCCYNIAGVHAAEERFFTSLLEGDGVSEDQRLVYRRLKDEATVLKSSREFVGKAIAADALTDVRVAEGVITPENLDGGEYIFGHQDSDTVLDEVTYHRLAQVISEVAEAMPEWQQTARNMERVFAAFVPPDIREFVANLNSLSMNVGKNSLHGEGVPQSIGEKLSQALKTGDKHLFKSASRALVARIGLMQGYLEALHYYTNHSLLKTLEERNGMLTLEEKTLV